jgi:predicted transcriptional regulator
MPRTIIDQISLAPQRYALADLVVQITKSAKDDILPFVTSWEFFQHILILVTMADLHAIDQVASINELVRRTSLSTDTARQRVQELLDRGVVEKRLNGFAITPEFFNSEFMLQGFRRRRILVSLADEATDERREAG